MRCIAVGLLAASCFSAHAGIWGTTAHSRANCFGFNESITWNAHEFHWWRVESVHFHKNGTNHKINTGMNWTWRAAAFHTGEWEGPSGNNWRVQGYHFYRNNNGREVYDVYTEAVDCSIYDGWWDIKA